MSKVNNASIWWLRTSCCLLLLGHAWICLFWDIPLRALFWDEALVGSVIAWLGVDWADFVSSDHWDERINAISYTMAFIYLCAAGAVFCAKKWSRVVLGLGAGQLLFLAALTYLEHGAASPVYFFEYALQFSLPITLCVSGDKALSTRTHYFLYLAVAGTFVSHGLLAMGWSWSVIGLAWYHAIPGMFVYMTMACLGIESTDIAKTFLFVAGCLDLVVSVCVVLLLRMKKLLVYALGYMVLWGFLTALARPWSYLVADMELSQQVYWLVQWFIRLPHWCVPVYLLMSLRKLPVTEKQS